MFDAIFDNVLFHNSYSFLSKKPYKYRLFRLFGNMFRPLGVSPLKLGLLRTLRPNKNRALNVFTEVTRKRDNLPLYKQLSQIWNITVERYKIIKHLKNHSRTSISDANKVSFIAPVRNDNFVPICIFFFLSD